MTEIKIEKKKPIWPWLLLGAIIAALLLYFFVFNKKDEDNTIEKTAMSEPAADLINIHENNTTVTEYVAFIQGDSNKMSLDHEFTNETLLKLIEATKAMANEIAYNVEGKLDTAKAYANQITSDPNVTTHANSIKKAANILTGVLQNMQQAKYSSLANEAANVKSSADAINPDVLTLDQRDAVKTFFSNAAEILRKMN